MNRLRTDVLQQNPYISVSYAGDALCNGVIEIIAYGTGEITVHHDNDLTPTRERCLTLAGLGIPNRKIGAALYLTDETVKSHLQKAYATLPFESRDEIALDKFTSGNWEIVEQANSLDLGEIELAIVERLAAGYTNQEIAQTIDSEPDTVVANIRDMMRRTGWPVRSALGLAGLVAADVDIITASDLWLAR